MATPVPGENLPAKCIYSMEDMLGRYGHHVAPPVCRMTATLGRLSKWIPRAEHALWGKIPFKKEASISPIQDYVFSLEQSE